MFPILLHIGPLTIRTYGALVATAFLASLQAARVAAHARRIGEAFLLDLVAILVMTGLLGARILYVLLNLSYFRQHPWESIKVWEGGLVFYGGFILAAVVGMIFTRYRGYPLEDVADCLAPGLALGQGIGRWGCFFAGCCYGKPTSLPWGVTFNDAASLAPLGIKLHPVQIYESIGADRHRRGALGSIDATEGISWRNFLALRASLWISTILDGDVPGRRSRSGDRRTVSLSDHRAGGDCGFGIHSAGEKNGAA